MGHFYLIIFRTYDYNSHPRVRFCADLAALFGGSSIFLRERGALAKVDKTVSDGFVYFRANSLPGFKGDDYVKGDLVLAHAFGECWEWAGISYAIYGDLSQCWTSRGSFIYYLDQKEFAA